VLLGTWPAALEGTPIGAALREAGATGEVDLSAASNPGSPLPVALERGEGRRALEISARVGAGEGGQSLLVLRDVTQRRLVEERLGHAQRLESVGQLAGGVAHDFNNLLQAVLGHLDLALPDLAPGSAARESVEQSAQAARRATDLTRQLLAYSGRGRFVVRQVDLSGLVRENGHLFRASVPHTCAIELRLAEGLPPAEADVGQVQQVIMNLITNAADAIGTQPGSISISTELREGGPGALAGSRLADVAPSDAYVCIEVVDTGCGMDPPTQERLFDPFFSTKGLGRGLGMSALLGIVRSHRGGLFVESSPGHGTTVRVLFPVSTAAAAQAPAPRPAVPAVAGTVLVVDDEALVRRACQSMLRSMGLKVLAAASGQEAEALLRAHPGEVRFVVLDLSMPGMDGVETLEALLAIEPRLRILLSSGFDEQAAAGRPSAARAAGFIQKPYSVADLRAALARAAER
jgi:signal transduction histidine kinase